MLRNIWLFFLCLGLGIRGYAQDNSQDNPQNVPQTFAEIKGMVSQKNSNEPIPSATIVVVETKQGTVTDTEGKFRLVNLKAGNYTLQFSAMGFKTQEQEVSLKAGESKIINFQVQENLLELQEVTVTAQKREELLQKAPLAVASISTEQIEKLQIANTNEVGRIAPNFQSYDDGGGMFTLMASRGIFTFDEIPTVGLYVDDVPIFNTMSFPSALNDLKRIEILRGPQGTLYGRNTLGGVINIITNTPRNTTEGFIELGYGNLNQLNVSAGVSTPLVPNKLYAKLSGSYLSRDGYITNTFLNTNDILSRESVTGNLKLTYYPNERWEFMLMSGLEVREVQANAYVGGFGFDNTKLDSLKDNHPYELAYDTQGTYNVLLSNNAFKIGYYTNNIAIKSITALQLTDVKSKNEDFDVSSFDLFKLTRNDRMMLTWSEELRISSTRKDSPFSWLGGLFLYHVQRDTDQYNQYGEDYAFGSPPEVAALLPYHVVDLGEITQTGASIFFNADYSFTPEWEVTAGLRYEIESNTTSTGRSYIKDGDASFSNPSAGLIPDSFKKTADYNAISPKIGLIYDKNQFLAYANIARSYRPGGINAFVLESDKAIFDPEYSWNYEIGLKSTLWKNRLKANLTGFYVDYKDQQVYTLVDMQSLSLGRRNVGQSISYGLELETEWVLAKGFKALFNIGYLETKVEKFTITNFSGEINNEGNKQAYSPQWNGNLGLNYETTFNNELSLTFAADYQFQTDMYFDVENTAQQESYGLLNSRLSFAYKAISISFWAKNLLDKTYFSYGYVSPGTTFLSYGMPQTFGTALKLEF